MSVYVVVGSWSHDSLSSRAARAALTRPPWRDCEVLAAPRLDRFPFFSRDSERCPPAIVVDERLKLGVCSRILIVAPIYNSLLPGAVMNFLDWMSRPWNHGIMMGKQLSLLTVGGSKTPPNRSALKTLFDRVGSKSDTATWLHVTKDEFDGDAMQVPKVALRDVSRDIVSAQDGQGFDSA